MVDNLYLLRAMTFVEKIILYCLIVKQLKKKKKKNEFNY